MSGGESRPHETQRRQDEISAGRAHVRFNGVNGINHIDTLLRPCAAKDCNAVGLQEAKRDGTSEIVASRYRVYFSCDCSEVKGNKGQHRVGLAMKEEIVEKAEKDGIAIEYISTRLLKVRTNQSIFVTFLVAYTPTEEAPKEQKAKYMAALNSTVASEPARKYFFVLTNANARTGKRVKEAGKQGARCWAHTTETCSTKTANYGSVSQTITSSLF